MTQTLYNGAVVPTNSDPYAITADLMKLALSLNVPIRVQDQAARNGLAAIAPGGVLPVGTEVLITGDPTMPKQKWNGSKWVQFVYAEASASVIVEPSLAYGTGQLTLIGKNSTDSTFVTFPEPDCIQFTQAGLYSVSAHMLLASGTVSGHTKGTIQSSNGSSVYGQTYPTPGASECVIAAPMVYFPNPGGRVYVKFFQASGANQTWSTLARIGKIG